MKKPASILEQIYFTTVRIESTYDNGSISTGTGFIFQYDNNDKSYLFLVSNKHVIEKAVNGKLAFNKNNNGSPAYGDIFEFIISYFSKRWIPHPD